MSDTVIEYLLLDSGKSCEMQALVNKSAKEGGWRLVGNVAVIRLDSFRCGYLATMFRVKPKKGI